MSIASDMVRKNFGEGDKIRDQGLGTPDDIVSPAAKMCNDEECLFFRSFIQNVAAQVTHGTVTSECRYENK